MAGILLQAKEMFKSIDPDNTGVLSRDELKLLMQEIGGDLWSGDNFDNMLEACGVAPDSAEVKYDVFLEQLLGGSEEKKAEAQMGEAPKVEAPKEESPKEEKSVPVAAKGTMKPSAQDVADAKAIVGPVCARVLASMKEAVQVKKEEAKPDAPAGDSPTVDASAKEDAPKDEAKQEEVKVESKPEEEAPAAAA